MNFRKMRVLHRFIAVISTLPLLIITITGLVLQLRGEFEFIQPRPIEIKVEGPLLRLETIEQKFGSDLEQVIWRPGKGSLVARLKGDREAHLNPLTGEVLKNSIRRTNFLIELHQGSWMGSWGQYFIHFLAGLGLFFLIVSGLFLYPIKRKNL